MQDTPNSKKTSARDSLQRVGEHLYRHSVHGTYYGIMTIGGKLKKKALCAFEGQAPTTDRATANRLLREWEEKLTRLDATAGDMRLEALLTKFKEVRAGKAANTVATEASIISRFESEFGLTMDTMVSRVKPSDVESWLAKVGDGLRHSSYNRFRQFVRQLFQLAVDDRVIAQSPFIEHRNKAKKKQKVIRNIPTAGEFEKIVAEIRQPAWEQVKGKHGGQRPMSFPESADFAEFLGRAGLGQAEARALKWGDVDFEKRRLRIVRKKTGEFFEVPIYADLMPLLTRMKEEVGAVRKDAEVFVIKDVKRALTNACKRLKLPHFTERNLRAMKIRELYEAGVDTKTIAKWQGHKDGGKLIMEIYTEVFSSGDQAYEAAQLAKADGKVIPFSNAA